jgi:hypothetical protein
MNGIIYLKLPTVFNVLSLYSGTDFCQVESDGNLQVVSTCSGVAGSCKTVTVTSITFPSSSCLLGIRYTAIAPINGINSEFIVLNINNFFGPVKYTDITGFLVYTVEVQSSSEYDVDKTDNIPQKLFMSATTSTLLTGSLQIYDSSGTQRTTLKVKQINYQYEFTINTNFPVAQDCTVKITFPDEITLPTTTAGMSLSGTDFLTGATLLTVSG